MPNGNDRDMNAWTQAILGSQEVKELDAKIEGEILWGSKLPDIPQRPRGIGYQAYLKSLEKEKEDAARQEHQES